MSGLKRISADEIRTRLQERPAFGHFVDLTGRLIDVQLDLSGLVLCGFDFTGSRFEEQVDFSNVTCKGISWFRGVHFSAEAIFRTACFFNDARFDGAVYEAGAIFRGAEFRGIATFDGCCSPAQLDFSDVLANGNFSIAGASYETLQVKCPFSKPHIGVPPSVGGRLPCHRGSPDRTSRFHDALNDASSLLSGSVGRCRPRDHYARFGRCDVPGGGGTHLK